MGNSSLRKTAGHRHSPIGSRLGRGKDPVLGAPRGGAGPLPGTGEQARLQRGNDI